jgi:Uma2 family endonuclease
MAQRSTKPATYADIEALPPNMVGQIVDGVLHTHPRPAIPHARAISSLGGALDGPFDKGRGGPGGWILLFEPELHLGTDVLVPDYGGWRRARMPELPIAPFVTLAPDWVCEGLSTSTAALDRGPKLVKYAREGVGHVWFLDPEPRTLEILRLDGSTYRLVATHSADDRVRAEPFEAIELELGLLWVR